MSRKFLKVRYIRLDKFSLVDRFKYMTCKTAADDSPPVDSELSAMDKRVKNKKSIPFSTSKNVTLGVNETIQNSENESEVVSLDFGVENVDRGELGDDIITTNGLSVENVSINSEDWHIVQDQQYRPDRAEFILNSFNEAYGKNITNVETVYELASRSKIVGDWLAKASLDYVDTEAVPPYMREKISNKDYETSSEQIEKLNKLQKDKSIELVKASNEYKTKIRLIEERFAKETSKTEQSSITKVLTLKSDMLPLTLQLAITNYTPAKNIGSPNTKAYARELLINYKRSLLDIIAATPNVNIDSIINGNLVK